jgi:hypothetical protein
MNSEQILSIAQNAGGKQEARFEITEEAEREANETTFSEAVDQCVTNVAGLNAGVVPTGGNPATPQSGGVKHDGERPRMDLISPIAIVALAKVLTFGAKKYESRNWEKGIAWSRCIAAILRHTFAFLGGQTHDPETGINHMAHVLCNAQFLVEFEVTHPEFDDRPKGKQ